MDGKEEEAKGREREGEETRILMPPLPKSYRRHCLSRLTEMHLHAHTQTQFDLLYNKSTTNRINGAGTLVLALLAAVSERLADFLDVFQPSSSFLYLRIFSRMS